MSALDFNDAKPNDFEVIPDNTEVPIMLKVQAGDPDLGDGCLKRGKNSDSIMLNLEATVTDGKYAKRKFFPSFFLGREGGELTEGQRTGVNMAREKLRAIVEAARGYAPTDESPQAVAARRLKSYMDLNNMECTVILGVEKGQNGFADKNVIKRVVPHGKKKTDSYNPAAEAASMRNAAKPTAQSRGW